MQTASQALWALTQSAFDILIGIPEAAQPFAMLGGGYFRSVLEGNPPKDVDIFFANLYDFETACAAFRADPMFTETTQSNQGMHPTFIRPGCPPYNLIGFRFHPNIQALVADFDFTCCCFAAMFIGPKVVLATTETAYEDVIARRLNFNKKQNIVRVLKRKDRYEAYGYTPTQEFLAELPSCEQIVLGDDPPY